MPGVLSARFALNEQTGKSDFPLAFEKILTALQKKGVKFDETTSPKAHFICNLTIYDPQQNAEFSFEGRVDGIITNNPRGLKGFGYDPIFIKNGMTQTFAQLEPAFKDSISHRAQAFNKLKNWAGHL